MALIPACLASLAHAWCAAPPTGRRGAWQWGACYGPDSCLPCVTRPRVVCSAADREAWRVAEARLATLFPTDAPSLLALGLEQYWQHTALR